MMMMMMNKSKIRNKILKNLNKEQNKTDKRTRLFIFFIVVVVAFVWDLILRKRKQK
jgi:IS4 transposase